MPKSQTYIRRALGFWYVLVNYAGISGMRAPVPGWFLGLPKPVQIFSKALFIVCELSLIFMAISLIKGIMDEPNLSKRIECVGSLILLMSAFIKFTLLRKQHKDFENFIADLHAVGHELLFNPVGDRTYLELHHNKTRYIHLYYKLRYSSFIILCSALMSVVLYQGMAYPSADQRLPMSGWFPIDRSSPIQFLLASFTQFEYYMLISLRDFYCDAVIHFSLAAINVQFIYLQQLLEMIVRENGNTNRNLIRWWIVQHQNVLRTFNQFMIVAGPQLTILNAVSALQLFMYLFRLTEEDEVLITKHIAVSTVCSFMLIHVYIVSNLGDDITSNSAKISLSFDNQQFWDLDRKDKLLLHHVAIRCTVPTSPRYAKIFKLRVETFGTICSKLIGFFNTIYQIRNGS